MSKFKIKYICNNCGYDSLRWLGKCPNCQSWNTFFEEVIESKKQAEISSLYLNKIKKLNDISFKPESRMKTGIEEFDRILGGGIVYGSVTLIGGDPGIGKSTLVLQVADKLKEKVLYVTAEESDQQLNIRAKRLKLKSENLFILPESSINSILSAIENEKPSLVIIDSIQAVYDEKFGTSSGTVTQIRESASVLINEAKKKNFAVVLIGHVTKEGIIAGPKILEHIVDTVIQFEGEQNNSYRILRANKNRFGSTNEIGIFEMHDDGLSEVKNPSLVFLNNRNSEISGSAITSSIEGTRSFLIEIQALVTPSNFGNPQRISVGFDNRRLSILLAVIEKRAGHRLSATNVFLNIAGGVKIFEPAVDLAVCCAIVSSLLDRMVDSKTVLIGEVGLGGEIRTVSNIEKRIQEAEKLGFKRAIIPVNRANKYDSSIQLIDVEHLKEVIDLVLK